MVQKDPLQGKTPRNKKLSNKTESLPCCYEDYVIGKRVLHQFLFEWHQSDGKIWRSSLLIRNTRSRRSSLIHRRPLKSHDCEIESQSIID